MKTTAKAIVLSALLLAACGSSSSIPSRGQVEQEVGRQARALVTDSHGQKVAPVTHCVESTAARIYDCTVALKIGSGKYYVTSKPQSVTATVSKDGKAIVVDGLR